MIKRIICVLMSICIIIGIVAMIAPMASAEVSTTSDNVSMTTSDACIKYIKSEEGFCKYPYYDYGQYTVGYGTRCPGDKYYYYKEHGITEEEAEELLRVHLSYIEDEICNKLIVKYDLTFTQNQYDAIVSITYNIGSSWMTSTSGILHKAIVGKMTGNDLIGAFSIYCKAGGELLPALLRRRLCEADMYLNGSYSTAQNQNFGCVYFDPNGGTVDHVVQGFDVTSEVAVAETAVFEGRTFMGWYTAKTGGEKVEVLKENLAGSTLYARWDPEYVEKDSTIEPTEISVTGNNVNIRKGPGLMHQIVGKANKGDKLTITQVQSGSSYEWGKSDIGWIALKYTNYNTNTTGNENVEQSGKGEKPEDTTNNPTTPPVEETPTPSEPSTETTTPTEPTNPTPDVNDTTTTLVGKVKVSDCLRVRTGPGTNYKIFGVLYNATEVTILEQKTVDGMNWGRIGDNKWISLTYVVLENKTNDTTSSDEEGPTGNENNDANDSDKVTEENTTITGIVNVSDRLRVRSGPGTTNNIVGYLTNGKKVEITETTMVDNVKWGKINNGWISMDYVRVGETSTNEQTQSETKTITADCLRIRKDAGKENAIIGYLYNGDKVDIFETKTAKDGTLWGKINKGWISMDYAK